MEQVFEKLRAVEFERLPPRVQMAHLARPVLSAPVEPFGGAFRLVSPAGLDRPAMQALVPKLAIKSWRDAGTLGVIHEGLNVRLVVEQLLRHPTAPQRLAARAWTQAGLPLHLHLSPYVDFSDVSEVRFLTNPNECRRVSTCLRGRSAEDFASALPGLTAFALQIAAHLPPRSHVLDVGLRPTGDIRLVDVNPGLTPQELAALRSDAHA